MEHRSSSRAKLLRPARALTGAIWIVVALGFLFARDPLLIAAAASALMQIVKII